MKHNNVKVLNDLNLNQSSMYNEMIIDFFNDYNPAGHLRFGQALYNHFYGIVFNGSYPELFYCEDNNKAGDMFSTCLVDYVKGKVQ